MDEHVVYTCVVDVCVTVNLRCHTPSPSLHQVQGLLDLYPVSLAHPFGMPCILKQVLHFEISSRYDISGRLNISGSRILQPSEHKYPQCCIRLPLQSQVHNCPLVSNRLLPPARPPPTPPHLVPGEVLSHCTASHICFGSQPDRCRDAVINQPRGAQCESDLQNVLVQRSLNFPCAINYTVCKN